MSKQMKFSIAFMVFSVLGLTVSMFAAAELANWASIMASILFAILSVISIKRVDDSFIDDGGGI